MNVNAVARGVLEGCWKRGCPDPSAGLSWGNGPAGDGGIAGRGRWVSSRGSDHGVGDSSRRCPGAGSVEDGIGGGVTIPGGGGGLPAGGGGRSPPGGGPDTPPPP